MTKSSRDLAAILGGIVGAIAGSSAFKDHPKKAGVAGGLLGAIAGDQAFAGIEQAKQESERRGHLRGLNSAVAVYQSFFQVYLDDGLRVLTSQPDRDISKAELRQAYRAGREQLFTRIDQNLSRLYAAADASLMASAETDARDLHTAADRLAAYFIETLPD